jgi:hypothetical protein
VLAWFSFSDHALLEVRADSIGIGSKRSGRNAHHTLGVVDKSKPFDRRTWRPPDAAFKSVAFNLEVGGQRLPLLVWRIFKPEKSELELVQKEAMGEPNEQAALSQLRALQSELELVDEQASAKVKCRVLLISLCCHRLCSVSRAGQVVQIENEAAKKRRPVYEQRQVRQAVRSPS